MKNKMMNVRIAVLLVSLYLGVSSAAADITVIHAGELLAVPGEASKKAQSIVVENGLIVAVRNGFISPHEFDGEVELVDLKDQFVLPGLMDMHVHMLFEIGPNSKAKGLKISSELKQMKGVLYGRRTLAAGFTTVRDLGSTPQSIYALRDAIEHGWVEGPRIIAAGKVGITGGHGDISGLGPELMKMMTHDNICDGPYDCRRATRNAIKYGADWIKVSATGGVLSDRATGTGQQMGDDELSEIVDAAHQMGRKVAAHAHDQQGIMAALKAGVASVEHGTYAGREAIKLFKKTGTYLVPTLLAGETVRQMSLASDLLSEAVKTKAIRVSSTMKDNFYRVQKAGVNIAYGTDSGVSKHGTNAREAVLMHEAGMKPMDIIQSATVNSADLLGMTEVIGSIEKGKYADVIAVSRSPLEDIEALMNVVFVMKDGKIFKQ
jgi:imidazolonepropionase-like amidohydrolase